MLPESTMSYEENLKDLLKNFSKIFLSQQNFLKLQTLDVRGEFQAHVYGLPIKVLIFCDVERIGAF